MTSKPKNAPIIPNGLTVGKESLVFSYSNSILDIVPFMDISDAARTFYMYVTTIILDETHNSLKNGTFSFKDKSKRFAFNIKDFLKVSEQAGKKHYTFNEIKEASQELVGKPLTFVREDGEAFTTVAFFSEITVDTVTGDCYFDVASSLLSHYVPELSARKEAHLISLLESFKFSNSYTDALYKLINGYIQTIDTPKDYAISILVLKKKLGLTPQQSCWDNKRFIPRVLNKAVDLINQVSDISLSYEITKYEKQNRIKDIVFTNIKRKGIDDATDVVIDMEDENSIECDDVLCSSSAEKTKGNITSNESSVIITPEEHNIVPDTNTTANLYDEVSETEIVMAKILTICRKEGFNISESMQIYELYKDNHKKLLAIVDTFNALLHHGIKKEEDKFTFFLMPNI